MGGQVKVLQVINGQSGTLGGIETFLIERYKRMDRAKIRMDFAFTKDNTMKLVMNDEAFADSEFVETHAFEKSTPLKRYRAFYRELCRLIKKNDYDIVHVNSGAPSIEMIALLAAGRCGVQTKIAHSHISQAVGNGKPQKTTGIKKVFEDLLKRGICRKADMLFACSHAAGETLFGHEMLLSPKYCLLKNGIDCDKFRFCAAERKSCREENGVKDLLVVGAIGRLCYQKNPHFILEAFAALHKREKQSVLWFVGNGDMFSETETNIRELGLTDCVTLWGERRDVPTLMQAMDVILLPSHYEGLSIVSVETQMAGLPVYASDNISEEHKITELLHFLPLSAGPEHWAERILKDRERAPDRKDMTEEIRAAGYDIDDSTAMLESIYLQHGEK